MKPLSLFVVVSLLFSIASWSSLAAQEDDVRTKPIRALSSALVAALNAGQLDQVAALFIEDGELIDEQGTVHRGRDEIKQLLVSFGERFPGAAMTIESESIRFVGPIAIDDGTRITTDANGETAVIQYTATLVQTSDGWRIASVRDFPDEVPATPGEMLRSLEWIIGDWINEGTDGRVAISYQWSEDGNFILGEFVVTSEGQVVGKSSHRIGWDPLLGKPRSWLFDSDGGFSEAIWTEVEDGWMLRSSATMPDGVVGTATLRITIQDTNRFLLAGTDRVIGDLVDDDYELVVVRRPATSSK